MLDLDPVMFHTLLVSLATCVCVTNGNNNVSAIPATSTTSDDGRFSTAVVDHGTVTMATNKGSTPGFMTQNMEFSQSTITLWLGLTWRTEVPTTAMMFYANPTPDQVEYYLKLTSTLEFLSQFENALQRETVRTQLKHCPFSDLCTFSLDLPNLLYSMKSCCDECRCDYPLCVETQSCCPDILPAMYFDMTTLPAELQTPSRCTLMHARFISGHKNSRDYMQTGCPLGTSPDILQRCLNVYSPESIDTVSDMLPIDHYTSTYEYKTYRNKYCARCQGVPEAEMISWDAKLSCNTSVVNDYSFLMDQRALINFIFDSDLCYIDFTFGLDTIYIQNEDCRVGINLCNVTGLWKTYDPVIDRQCQLYTSAIRQGYYRFQNIFCMICNGMDSDQTLCSISHGQEGGDTYSFSGLLKLSDDTASDTSTDEDKDAVCRRHEEIYDDQTGSCVAVQCSQLHTWTNETCIRLFDSMIYVTYTFFIKLFPVNARTLGEVYDQVYLVKWAFDMLFIWSGDVFPEPKMEPGSMCNIETFYALDDDSVTKIAPDTIASTLVKFVFIRLNVVTKSANSPYDVSSKLREIDKINITLEPFTETTDTHQYILRIVDHFGYPFDTFLNMSTLQHFHAYSYNVLHRKGILDVNNISVDEMSDIGNLYVPYVYNDTQSAVINAYDACSEDTETMKPMTIRDCPMVTVNLSDYYWLENEDGLYNPNSSYTLKHVDLSYITEDMVHVCLDVFKKIRVVNSSYIAYVGGPLSIETVLSIILVSVSLTCLFITVAVYCVLPSLQTLPGKNTMALSISVFIAQSLYLTSSFGGLIKMSLACITVGVALHFFWLVTIFWMQVCTFHMLTVLTITKLTSPNHGRKLFFYHCYAILMSLLFVGANITVSYVTSEGSSIGYGASVCYISSSVMLQYTFGVPTFIVVLSNIIMFIYVITSMKRMTNIKRSQERNDLVIFLKLSSLTGVTWVFGFLYTWTNISAFSYLFIVLSSSKGVFILISFVLNRRVVALLKMRLDSSLVTTKSSSLPSSGKKYVTRDMSPVSSVKVRQISVSPMLPIKMKTKETVVTKVSTTSTLVESDVK